MKNYIVMLSISILGWKSLCVASERQLERDMRQDPVCVILPNFADHNARKIGHFAIYGSKKAFFAESKKSSSFMLALNWIHDQSQKQKIIKK